MCKMPFSVPRLKLPFFSGNRDFKHGVRVAPVLPPGRAWYWDMSRSGSGLLWRCSPYLQASAVACRHSWGRLPASCLSPVPPPLTPVCLPCSARLLTPHSPSQWGSDPRSLSAGHLRGPGHPCSPSILPHNHLHPCQHLQLRTGVPQPGQVQLCLHIQRETLDWGEPAASTNARCRPSVPLLPGPCWPGLTPGRLGWGWCGHTFPRSGLRWAVPVP